MDLDRRVTTAYEELRMDVYRYLLTMSIQLAPATPAIFTADATGRGQGAILNENASVNNTTNPAAKGKVVVPHGTGGGAPTGSPLCGNSSRARPRRNPNQRQTVIIQVGDQSSRPDVTLAVQ